MPIQSSPSTGTDLDHPELWQTRIQGQSLRSLAQANPPRREGELKFPSKDVMESARPQHGKLISSTTVGDDIHALLDGFHSLEPLLRQYYGDSFSKVAEAGKFTTWLRTNSTKIQQTLIDLVVADKVPAMGDEKANPIATSYIVGALYAHHQATGKWPATLPSFGYGLDGYATGSAYAAIPSCSNLTPQQCVVSNTNTGIHEGTHLIRKMSSGQGLLTEAATAEAMKRWGLPTKVEESKDVGQSGKRDILSLKERLAPKDFVQSTVGEYMAYLCRPWLGRDNTLNPFPVSKQKSIDKLELTMEGFYSLVNGVAPEKVASVVQTWVKGFCDHNGYKDVTKLTTVMQSLAVQMRSQAIHKQLDAYVQNPSQATSASIQAWQKLIDSFINTMTRTFGQPQRLVIPAGYAALPDSSSTV